MTAIFDSPAESLGEHIDRLTAIEAAADTVHTWEPVLIPGLLQSYAYACAAIHTSAPALPLEEVAARAEARRRRIDRSGCRSITAVLDEAALCRPVGGYATLVDQLGHILALDALQPSLTVRVLPQGLDAHPGLLGGFTLYRTGGKRAVFVESLTDSSISTRPEDVAAYSSAWERLTGLALPARESADLIDGVKETACRRWRTRR